MMKLRLDLLEHLTDKDILEEVLANNHRYMPEPLFAKTGTGYLSPTTQEDVANEISRSQALIRKLKRRSKRRENPARKARLYRINKNVAADEIRATRGFA